MDWITAYEKNNPHIREEQLARINGRPGFRPADPSPDTIRARRWERTHYTRATMCPTCHLAHPCQCDD